MIISDDFYGITSKWESELLSKAGISPKSQEKHYDMVCGARQFLMWFRDTQAGELK